MLFEYPCVLQEVWKISTTAGSKRVKKGLAGHESSTTSHSLVEASRVSSAALSASATAQSQSNVDSVQVGSHLSLHFKVLYEF